MQAIVTVRQLRATLIAVVMALLVQFVLLPMAPGIAFLTTAIAVVATIVVTWLARDRKSAAGRRKLT